MSKGNQRFVEQLRRVVRDEAQNVVPATQRFVVVKLKPFTIESLHSDSRLVEGDEDFEIARAVKKDAKVGDCCLLSTDPGGGRTAHGLI